MSTSSKFNEASGSSKKQPERDISHEQLNSRLDNYTKAAFPEGRDAAFMKQLRDKYTERIEKKQIDVFAQHQQFNHGVKAGIQRKVDRKNIERGAKVEFQQIRNDIAQEGKVYYRENYSLTKKFNRNAELPGKSKADRQDRSSDKEI